MHSITIGVEPVSVCMENSTSCLLLPSTKNRVAGTLPLIEYRYRKCRARMKSDCPRAPAIHRRPGRAVCPMPPWSRSHADDRSPTLKWSNRWLRASRSDKLIARLPVNVLMTFRLFAVIMMRGYVTTTAGGLYFSSTVIGSVMILRKASDACWAEPSGQPSSTLMNGDHNRPY